MKPANCRKSFPLKGMAVTAALVASLGLGQASAKTLDLDGDGIANLVDPDVDGDGISNGSDLNADGGVCRRGPLKGRYVGDRLLNDNARENDMDADGLKDNSAAELDIDGDGRKDDSKDELDIDGDGKRDDSDGDMDGDGLLNDDIRENDLDGDGRPNPVDLDFNGDGINDYVEVEPEILGDDSELAQVDPEPIVIVGSGSDSAVSCYVEIAPEMDPQRVAELIQGWIDSRESSDRPPGFFDRFTEAAVVDPVEDRRSRRSDLTGGIVVTEPVSIEEVIP